MARKQWLATLPVRGRVVLDPGACDVLREKGRSLLAVGVVSTSSGYTRGDMVSCVGRSGEEIARGLVNYSSADVTRLCGVSSDRIESVLGFVAEEELIHRDNLFLV